MRYVRNPRGPRLRFDLEPSFPPIAGELISETTNLSSVGGCQMKGSRSERARAGTISFGSNRILTADGEMQRLRQLSMKYIREAERLER